MESIVKILGVCKLLVEVFSCHLASRICRVLQNYQVFLVFLVFQAFRAFRAFRAFMALKLRPRRFESGKEAEQAQ